MQTANIKKKIQFKNESWNWEFSKEKIQMSSEH